LAVSNFLIQVNIVPFLVDRILQRQKAGCDPASDAEEHSPVILTKNLFFSPLLPPSLHPSRKMDGIPNLLCVLAVVPEIDPVLSN
jgi:hypothetical protein